MKYQPLVTVLVITYNSSKTVVETLDSIYNQTYPNLELIITDDASRDDTIKLCDKWIKCHSERFKDVKVLTSPINSGTAANLNRAERSCDNEWVKLIAGDDLLEPTCISDYVEYIQNHPDAIYVFGRVENFGTSNSRIEYFNKFFKYDFFLLSREEQLDCLVNEGNCIPAPSFFYNLKEKKNLDLHWDERVPILEDLPMWINALKKGLKLHFIDKVTARYRVGAGGVTSGSGNSKFAESIWKYNLLYVFPYKYETNKEEGLNYLTNLVDGIRDYYMSRKEFTIGGKILKPLRAIKHIFIN